MKRQLTWLILDYGPVFLPNLLNPFRFLFVWYNNRVMRQYLMTFIEKRLAENRDRVGETTSISTSTISTSTAGTEWQTKTINSLAIDAYVSEKIKTAGEVGGGDAQSLGLFNNIDKEFLHVTIQHLKIFMFGAYDTTTTTLGFALHFLHNNPSTLAALRAEHDTVFGPSNTTSITTKSTTESQIAANPQLLNALPYTAAVVKETLRLSPPIGSIRKGQPDFHLTHPETGVRYPTDGYMLFSCSFAEQRNPEFWPRPDEFVPERWLAREGEPLHVRKNAFRAFELGPRACIGQDMAQLVLRTLLVLITRELDVESCYPDDAPEVLGDKAYQILDRGMVAAHPSMGMPMRVRMRGGGMK
jgi:Cytochrome P450